MPSSKSREMWRLPSSAEEGQADAVAAAGVVLVKEIHLLTNTTPSAPSTVASHHSIDGAASPPRLRRGVRVTSPKVLNKIHRVSDNGHHVLSQMCRGERC